jgi:hypothetical protein
MPKVVNTDTMANAPKTNTTALWDSLLRERLGFQRSPAEIPPEAGLGKTLSVITSLADKPEIDAWSYPICRSGLG